MFNKLKNLSNNVLRNIKTGKTIFEERAEKKLIEEFEKAYINGIERQLLIEASNIREPFEDEANYIAKMKIYEANKLRNKVFREQMQKKYDEKQVIELLKNNPNEFFARGWCYPNKNFTSLSIYTGLDGMIAGGTYNWNFLMPDSFWKSADNIQLFYKAGAKFINDSLKTHIDKIDVLNSRKIDDLLMYVRGFRMETTLHRDKYLKNIKARLNANKELLAGVTALDDIIGIEKEVEFLESENAKLEPLKLFNCASAKFLEKERDVVKKRETREYEAYREAKENEFFG